MDEPTILALIQRHAGLIYKVASAYCRDPTQREDAIQEIAVQLWRSRERYDPRYRETTWVYRVALNVAISLDRRERRHRGHVPIDEHMLTVEPAAPRAEIEPLLAALAELAPLDRALVLLALDGNEHAVIAEVLGISPSNVGTRLARLKARLAARVTAAASPAPPPLPPPSRPDGPPTPAERARGAEEPPR
jgi:RNA polymerase sigma-70 factor (ECF subfamily)